jgi:hypothetical protein
MVPGLENILCNTTTFLSLALIIECANLKVKKIYTTVIVFTTLHFLRNLQMGPVS